jgi:hypothetical protein
LILKKKRLGMSNHVIRLPSDTDDDGDFSLRRNVKVVVSSGLSLETKSFGFNTFVFADVLFGFLEDDTSLGDGGL